MKTMETKLNTTLSLTYFILVIIYREFLLSNRRHVHSSHKKPDYDATMQDERDYGKQKRA